MLHTCVTYMNGAIVSALLCTHFVDKIMNGDVQKSTVSIAFGV